MRILVAEDDFSTRRTLQAMLARWGYEVLTACDGKEAWQMLQEPDAPLLAIVDWIMPGMDGVEICRRLREAPHTQAAYLIVLTGKTAKEDIVAGLEAGADDYITKPFSREELRARIQVGKRVVELQSALAARVNDLHDALEREKKTLAELKTSNEQLLDEIERRKQVEEDLRKARDEVSQLLAERTDKLSKAGELLKRSIDRFKDITET